MRKLIFHLIAFSAFISIISCSGEPKEEMESQTSFDQKEMITMLASDIDPACGMELVIDLENEEFAFEDTTTYEGKIYGFCSASCKENFLTDPETYLAQLPDHGAEHDEGGEDHN